MPGSAKKDLTHADKEDIRQAIREIRAALAAHSAG